MSSNFQRTQAHSSLSKYEVIKPLGRGAGSFVYKIKDRKTGKHAALKVIEKKSAKFQKIRARFQNEIEIQSKLDNEYIVKLLSHFEDEDNYYILLELCQGGEIYNKIKAKGKLSEDEVRNYGFQFAQGLKYMHDNNIMHRDLKLSNLLLTEQGTLKICDFGLSVHLTDMKPERETLCGTPNYLAPELVNHESYGIKADCWAFGCILYAMTTGNPPFEGESVKETLLNVRRGEFQMPDYISKQLKDLLANLMNWDPSKRFNIDDAIRHPFFASCSNQLKSSIAEEDELSKYRKEAKRISNIEDNSQRNKVLEYAKLNQNSLIGAKRFTNHTKCLSTVTSAGPIDSPSSGPLTSITNSIVNEARHNLPPRQPKVCKGKENAAAIKLGEFLNTNQHTLIKKSSEVYKKLLTPINLANINRTVSPSLPRDQSNENKNRGVSSIVLQNVELRDRENGNSRIHHKRIKTEYEEPSSRNQSYTLNTSITLNTTARTRASPSRGGGEQFLSFVTEEDDVLKTERRLIPLNTFGLTPSKFAIKNGTFEIDENGIIDIDFVQSHGKLTISPDGTKVTIKKYYPNIEEKTYALSKLPSKYNKFYEYASKVCEVIKSKLPKIKFEDDEGVFCLLQNKPFPHFEAKFKNGIKAQHTLSSEIVRLDMSDGSIYEINILRDTSYLGDFMCSVLNKTLEKMNLCVQKEIQSK